MATAVKRKLSGSTNGLPIKVAATATAGTAIHAAVAGTTPGTFDEIWLWAVNSHTNNVLLTLEWGDVHPPDDIVSMVIPPGVGPVPVVPGWILQNSKAVTAFAALANVITIIGFVNAITD